MNKNRERSLYLTLTKSENKLRISLRPQGRAEIRERIAQNPQYRDDFLFVDLMENFLCNGWTVVRPEQVGDLRDDAMLTLTDEFTFEDIGTDDNMVVGTAWTHTNYCFELLIPTLRKKGYVDFERHDYLEPEEKDRVFAEVFARRDAAEAALDAELEARNA